MDIRKIAHDMRTPLNAVVLSVSAARAMAGGNEGLQKSLLIIERNAAELSRMIESLLVTNERESQGKSTLVLRECVPQELIARALDQAMPMAVEKSQRLESGEEADLPPLVADGERIVRVLVNLLTNAVKFTPAGGRIEVHAKSRINDGHPSVVFSVIDDGPGVSREEISRIFVEGVSIAKNNNPSNGLGLAVCKEIVEAHRGRIWVEENHAPGSVFSFAIPIGLELTT